jgi:hypothetical protein
MSKKLENEISALLNSINNTKLKTPNKVNIKGRIKKIKKKVSKKQKKTNNNLKKLLNNISSTTIPNITKNNQIDNLIEQATLTNHRNKQPKKTNLEYELEDELEGRDNELLIMETDMNAMDKAMSEMRDYIVKKDSEFDMLIERIIEKETIINALEDKVEMLNYQILLNDSNPIKLGKIPTKKGKMNQSNSVLDEMIYNKKLKGLTGKRIELEDPSFSYNRETKKQKKEREAQITNFLKYDKSLTPSIRKGAFKNSMIMNDALGSNIQKKIKDAKKRVKEGKANDIAEALASNPRRRSLRERGSTSLYY